VANRKEQQERGDHQQSDPQTRDLETLADGNQQQDGCKRHGCSHVLVRVLPAFGALFQGLQSSIIQLGSRLCLGASVFRHQLRTRRRIDVVDWINLLPILKGGTKLGQETPFKEIGELRIPVGFGL
jgi:hypothetical protein